MPPGSAFVVVFTEPLVKAKSVTPGSMVLVESSETLPVGVPVAGGVGVTPICTVTAVPWTIDVVGLSDKVVALGLSAEVMVLHLLTRLAALTEPRPVVRS